IDLGWLRGKAKARRPRDGASVLGGGDQRLRGNAAGIEAIAPHLALLDQHNGRAKGGGGGGDGKSAGARADDADVWFQELGHQRTDGRGQKINRTGLIARRSGADDREPSARAISRCSSADCPPSVVLCFSNVS